jgi:hypothetical protein
MTSSDQTDVNRPPHRWRSLGSAYVPPPVGPSYRSFGLTVGGVLAGIAALSAWRSHATRAEIVGAIAALLIVLALLRPVSLAGSAAAWSRVGHALGWFNSRVLLTAMFVLIIWPIGLVSRLFGSDPLERRRRSGSMWAPYPERLRDPRHFEHLF